ncbi:PREDICTED: mitochondrial import inner membrane translocase subunit Tim9 isoform X3 [Calidris pugnax]|uniref:mitochondrial import inner membrane translocase subunit Tim9 isoform X3 n=1 Tax=Calidris pugnax TaxID=198806 RepID=UPI00071C80E5|nr:PREDICTED: mitochondrial import inner membrane translocase subunit Tim9 isoform X3 [Calidris pugnax]
MATAATRTPSRPHAVTALNSVRRETCSRASRASRQRCGGGWERCFPVEESPLIEQGLGPHPGDRTYSDQRAVYILSSSHHLTRSLSHIAISLRRQSTACVEREDLICLGNLQGCFQD